MVLKRNNANSEIVLARKINLFKQFFFETVKIAFRNESYKLFFQEDV